MGYNRHIPVIYNIHLEKKCKTGGWTKLHNKLLHDVHPLSNMTGVIKQRSMTQPSMGRVWGRKMQTGET
jgi:hypothetical protein